MQWEQPPVDAGAADNHLAELAAFVKAQLGRGPAVLWTEYEPPARTLRGLMHTPEQAAAEVAAALGSLLGRASDALPVPVRDLRRASGRAALPALPADPARPGIEGDLLLLQCRRASDLLIHPAVGAATAAAARRAASRLRLRGGQSLLLPPGWSCTLDGRPAVHPLVLSLPPTGTPTT
ncbi:hypothetical protein ABT095_27970 [Kitasatospora sp. NPDC002227]|uniref:hypothetical protein n=1 Tax=Kitasatospora sp. NPDC002227 TaxID=3154773 RepID=UPI00331B65C1